MKPEISEALWDLIYNQAERDASYNGDPIDDYEIFYSEDHDDRFILRIMTPVGQELYYLIIDNVITLLHDSWGLKK